MAAGIGGPLKGPLLVAITVAVKQPKKTTLEYPKPDVDNYAKAILDALNGWLWEDDTQVVGLVIAKEWAEPEEDGYIIIEVKNDGFETAWARFMPGVSE